MNIQTIKENIEKYFNGNEELSDEINDLLKCFVAELNVGTIRAAQNNNDN
jgi:hypothetical protein